MTNPRRLLERDIERQLRWGPNVHAPPIIVTAHQGAVSLLDAIDLHGETSAAWETAIQVDSARAQDAAVKLFTEHVRRDSLHAELAVSNQVLVSPGMGLMVRDGSVTLERQITWNYRRDAQRAIQYLSNAIGLSTLEPQGSVSYANEDVECALKSLQMDASKK